MQQVLNKNVYSISQSLINKLKQIYPNQVSLSEQSQFQNGVDAGKQTVINWLENELRKQ